MKTAVIYFMNMCYCINDILIISLNVGFFYIFVFFAVIKSLSWLSCNSHSLLFADGLFNQYISQQEYKPRWSQIIPKSTKG